MANTELDRPERVLRPESRLLLATAGGDGFDGEIARLAAGPIDWTLFLQLTAGERAEAIVSARLGRVAPAVPEKVRQELKAMAFRSDLRMTRLSQRLDETVAAFAERQIPVVLLKGAALGRSVYRSLPKRPMLDLDLLVPHERRSEAREASLATGWVTTEFERQAEFYAGHYHMAPLRDGRTGPAINLEIHSGLFAEGHPFDWPMERLWQRSLPLEGSSARVPSPEDLLLHIALHFTWSHLARFGPWRTLRDVRMIAEDRRIDWNKFVTLAQVTRGASATYWTLRFARLMAGAPIPPEVEDSLHPPLPASVVRVLDRHFSGQWCTLEEPCPSERLGRWLWRLAVRPGRSGHGESVPWRRDALFENPHSPRVAEPMGRKIARHLTSPGTYLRYLHRIVLGIQP